MMPTPSATAKTSNTRLKDLRRSIENLAETAPNIYGQTISIEGDLEGAFALILAEINQTVLPRVLTINLHPAAKLTLKVSHRRLFECCSTDQRVSGRSQNSSDPKAMAHEFVVILKETLSRSQTICIETPKAIDEVGDRSMSCSVHALQDVAGISIGEDSDKTSDMRRMKHITSLAYAWRLTERGEKENDIYGSTDDQDLLQKLHHVLFSSDGTDHSAPSMTESDVCFICPLDDASVILAIERGDMKLLALMSLEDFAKLEAP